MVPLVASVRELEIVKADIDRADRRGPGGARRTLDFKVGTMIELPRAAFLADRIAQ